MTRHDMRKIIPKLRVLPSMEISWRDLAITLVPIILISLLAIWAAIRFVNPAPPNHITITSGPEGSTFQTTAKKYQKILARSGVKLRILPSGGSLENLNRLNNPSFHVDIGFVQGGVSGGKNIDKLVSLGSIFHEPLEIFYRGAAPVMRLSELSGKRLAIGPEGSGTRFLALALLKANGIETGGSTALLDLSGEDAAQALIHGKIDAAFLMGDSATVHVMRELFLTPGVQLMNFEQAEAYLRRFPYLNALELPMGSIDLGKNIPDHDVSLIAPTVELIAREDLHPALSDLLIEAATEVHASAGLLRRAGEFPAPLEHEFRISDDAKRYYTSGKSFLYRHLPFWLASFADRMLVILVPIVVLLIPGLRMTPALYRWRVRSRINRWYGALLALERDMRAATVPENREEMLGRLDDIEKAVNRMKMPRSFADQFYALREHIIFVRTQLMDSMA
ncbi:MAG TPA: TAXI family TRAP transporter solute-binding subunit [Burkholderiales bacterium]|nr:TAXI family TRAP transporter solute-binding subunit [Burkholderiales bacterium]